MADIMNGKVAATTGAASGMGPACVRTLFAKDATVVLLNRKRRPIYTLTEIDGDANNRKV